MLIVCCSPLFSLILHLSCISDATTGRKHNIFTYKNLKQFYYEKNIFT